MKITLILLLFASWPLLANKLLYTKQDLAILLQTKEYNEYFQHVKDIRPTQRDQAWKRNFTQAALSFCQQISRTEKFSTQNMSILQQLRSDPLLSEHSLFSKCHEQLFFTFLQQQKQLSVEQIAQFWQRSSHSPKLGYQLIKLAVQRHLTLPSSSMLQRVTNGPVATFYCRDKTVQQLLFSTILHNLATHKTTIKMQSNLFLNYDCLKQLQTSLKQALHDSNITKQQLAYYLLKKGKLLTKAQEQRFLFFYYMQTPVVGMPLNYAWNFISDLGNNYQQRVQFLTTIESLNFLPDELFVLPDPTRRKALLTHLQQNFPEYFDLYLNRCLSFFKGTKNFPFGNPTLHCREFIGQASNRQFIPVAYRHQLDQLKIGLK